MGASPPDEDDEAVEDAAYVSIAKLDNRDDSVQEASNKLPAVPTAVSKTVSNNLSNPLYQATYDVGCGCTIALMVAAKIFTFAILVFQSSPQVILMRSSVTNSAAIGVVIMTIIMMFKSRYPYVVIVPDMFSAPYLIQMSYQLCDEIKDEKSASATVLVLVLLVYSLSGTLHILMASFRMLRFAEFLPYPVFCGLFSAVGLTIIQRSILFAPGYQIIPTTAVAISLSLKIFKSKETRPAVTFMVIAIISTIIFYLVAKIKNISVDNMRDLGWLVESPVKSKELKNQLVPWVLWIYGDAPVRFELVRWDILITSCGAQISLLLILIALRRSMQLANLNRLFGCRAKTNRELTLHGYSQLFASFLGTFGGVFSGPDMVRVKRMHGGEVFPGVISVFALICITFSRFSGVDYIPKFIFTGILASEGIMMLDRFLFMPYRLAGVVEWLAVVIIAVTAFFDIFKGFFIGAAISLLLFSVRFYRTGCVKMTGTGLTIRSTVDRSDTASDWLSSHGEKIRVIQLRGTVAFANVPSVLDVVADILDLNTDKAKYSNTPQGKFYVWFRLLVKLARSELSNFQFFSFFLVKFERSTSTLQKCDDEFDRDIDDNIDIDIDKLYCHNNDETTSYYSNEKSNNIKTSADTTNKKMKEIKSKRYEDLNDKFPGKSHNNKNTRNDNVDSKNIDQQEKQENLRVSEYRSGRPKLALESMFTPLSESEKKHIYDNNFQDTVSPGKSINENCHDKNAIIAEDSNFPERNFHLGQISQKSQKSDESKMNFNEVNLIQEKVNMQLNTTKTNNLIINGHYENTDDFIFDIDIDIDIESGKTPSFPLTSPPLPPTHTASSSSSSYSSPVILPTPPLHSSFPSLSTSFNPNSHSKSHSISPPSSTSTTTSSSSFSFWDIYTRYKNRLNQQKQKQLKQQKSPQIVPDKIIRMNTPFRVSFSSKSTGLFHFFYVILFLVQFFRFIILF